MDLEEKVAIITGSGRGIGKAVAMSLAREGCKVVIVSNVREDIDRAFEELTREGAEVLPLCLDLSNDVNIRNLVDDTMKKFGTIDILINGAGVFLQKPFSELTADEWDMVMDINLRTYVLLSQMVLNVMKAKGSGYIINICSSIVFGRKHADRAAYSVSKHAVVGLSKVLYDAGHEHGIKVSTIYPDRTDTKMAREIVYSQEPEKWITPGDISDCIRFLLKTGDNFIIKDLYLEIF